MHTFSLDDNVVGQSGNVELQARAGVAWLVEEDARGECMSSRKDIEIPSNSPGKVAHATSCFLDSLDLTATLPRDVCQQDMSNVDENTV